MNESCFHEYFESVYNLKQLFRSDAFSRIFIEVENQSC